MKNLLRKSIGVMLILLILLSSFTACVNDNADANHPSGDGEHTHAFLPGFNESEHYIECACGEITDRAEHIFEWVIDVEPTDTSSGAKHRECILCDYIDKEVVDVPPETSEGGIVSLREELIVTLSEYLRDYHVSYEIPGHTLENKLDLLKRADSPIFVKFGDECYYAVAYYTPTHDNPEYESHDYCCYNEYIWVGFKNLDDILESWEENKLVAAFQINIQEFCQNLKNSSNEIKMEHFTLFNPIFSNGSVIKPEIEFDDMFIYINQRGAEVIYYSSDVAYHEPWSIDCVEINGEYYIKEFYSFEDNKGNNYKIDLSVNLGSYYDVLISNLPDFYTETKNNATNTYALFKIKDIIKIIN